MGHQTDHPGVVGQRIDDCLLMGEADTAGLWLHVVDASRRYLGSECILRFRLLGADYRRCAVKAAGGGTDPGFKPEPEGGGRTSAFIDLLKEIALASP